MTATHQKQKLACRGLAKDIDKLFAERVVVDVLGLFATRPKDENWRALKSLEKALAVAIGETGARDLMAPLFGVNDLRNAASHLGGGDADDAMQRVRISSEAPSVEQGAQMIAAIVETLAAAAAAAEKLPEKRAGSTGSPSHIGWGASTSFNGSAVHAILERA